LPEVVGSAGTFIEPHDVAGLADAIERLALDDKAALEHARAGLERAREFTWTRAAATLRRAYLDAVARRRQRDHHEAQGRQR
jgi:alpha-1,3-rhamnosyl/mannosyltransferase